MIDSVNSALGPSAATGSSASASTDSTDAFNTALASALDDPASDGIDPAQAAALRAKTAKTARDAELKSIREKGFRTWVRDTSIEKLKEELRKKVMADMGLTEADMAKMSSAMRMILEEKIKQEIEKRMEAMREAPKDSATTTGDKTDQAGNAGGGPPARQSKEVTITAQAAQNQEAQPTTPAAGDQPGKKDRDGNSCLVIPALSMGGGESLF